MYVLLPFVFIPTNSHHTQTVHSWTWQYSKLLHNVMTTALGAKLPPYSIVLDLDRKIRDFPTPKYLLLNCDINESPVPSKQLAMQRWIVLSSKEASTCCPSVIFVC